ncbi:hypothetical protein [Metabacillus halosaccharovorans]|uniref:hypothetical protein n=1 Tax=Metabacillus halosaccharovorans TaxID=930124 RepID=UPI00204092E1|nr:hypothetical protein [Metabacillus halosaccharovorans]MCM3444403.1 hypothetical protein [Metabacillus halosaccharovorans]
MIQTQMEIKKVYSFLGENNSWDLTENEEVAKQDKEFALASIEDLNDMACGGYIIEGKILTSDGKVVEWFEESEECEYGGMDYYECGYRIVQ